METVVIQLSNNCDVHGDKSNGDIFSHYPHSMAHHTHDSTAGFHKPPYPQMGICNYWQPKHRQTIHCNKDKANIKKLQYQEQKSYTVRLWCRPRQKNIAEAAPVNYNRPTAKEFATLASSNLYLIQWLKMKKTDNSKFNFNGHHAPALFIPCICMKGVK